MKKIVLITGLIVAVSLSTFARKLVTQGETYSTLGKYKVEIDDNFVTVNGFQHKPYVITFENTGLEARVFVVMERGCRKYYVLSDALSVQYLSNRNKFGIELLDKELEKEGYKTSDSALNRSEYFHQKVITRGERWKRDKTALIAAYFPMLLNNPENILAVN